MADTTRVLSLRLSEPDHAYLTEVAADEGYTDRAAFIREAINDALVRLGRPELADPHPSGRPRSDHQEDVALRVYG